MGVLKEFWVELVSYPLQKAMKARNFIVRGGKIKRFLHTRMSDIETYNLPKKRVPLHVITVTYNNELLLQHQVRLLNKYLTDDFIFVVADNSSDPNKRREIKSECIRNGVTYLSLPPNPYKTSSSSHGICLNWLCKNYLSVFNPAYFGFIDHDLYSASRHSIIDHLRKQPVYGHWQGQKGYWYLWAGMCFFNAAKVDARSLDFLPASIHGKYADTGGSNWKIIYSKLDQSKLSFPTHQYLNLREGNVPQSDKMELIGEWLHSFNGSYWMKVEAKENILFDYLNKL